MEKALSKHILTAAAVILGAYIFFKYLMRMFLPFLIAFVIAYVLQVPIRVLHERTGIKRGILSAVFVLGVVTFCGVIVFLLGNRLISEIERFVIAVSENSDKYVADFFAFVDSVAIKIPFIDHIGGDITGAVSDAVKNMIRSATSEIPGVLAYIIGMLPEILLFVVILIMASYYFCADFDSGIEALKSVMSPNVRTAVGRFKRRLKNTGLSYLKACAVLMLITYVELLVGFLMLGVQYAFTLALIVAAVDMLPILGVGTVLLPWSLWCWISGDTYTALGILIIFATVTVVRRFIEPRVIGSGIGLSPIMTLVSMYIGFRLFGFTGLFFSPLAAIIILHLLPENISEKLGLKTKELPQKERRKAKPDTA